MAHSYIPNYSGGRDQEDHGSEPVHGSKKYATQKKGLVSWLK
jgi:hypothetical protein